MKNIYISILLVITLLSCQKTTADKANTLIKDNMLKILIIADSYEPVETKIDSAFTPFDSPVFYRQALEVLELGKQVMEYEKKIKEAKSSMAIWADNYSELSRNEYQESKKEYDEYTEKYNDVKDKIIKVGEALKKNIEEEPQFIGFKVTHRYRAKNNAGNILMGDEFYLMNKDLSEIIVSYDMQSEEYMGIQEIEKRIKQGQL